MNINFPYQFNNRGRTDDTDMEKHIRDMIEQVLFTTPGERVNRPGFGCGVLQLVFQPNSTELAAATQFLIQGALQQWLGDVIQAQEVRVESNDSRLDIIVRYIILRTQETRVEAFSNLT